MNSAQECILLDRSEGVATIVIDRPDKRNAFDHAMWIHLASLLDEVAADEQVRVLVVKARGDHFSAGGDIAEMEQLIGDASVAAERLDAPMAAAAAMSRVPVPTIALVRGAARGGGCELAVACDLRWADTTASFGIPPARLGLVYGAAGTRQLVDTVGLPAARMLLFSGEPIDAEHARRLGLINRLCDPGDLDGEAERFVSALCSNSLSAIRGIKQVLRRVAAGQLEDDEVTRGLRHASYRSRDLREGVTAFLERRDPDFGDRSDDARS